MQLYIIIIILLIEYFVVFTIVQLHSNCIIIMIQIYSYIAFHGVESNFVLYAQCKYACVTCTCNTRYIKS